MMENTKTEHIAVAVKNLRTRIAEVLAMSEVERNHAEGKNASPFTMLEVQAMMLSRLTEILESRGVTVNSPEFGPEIELTRNSTGNWEVKCFR